MTVMVAAAEKAAKALKRDFGEVENLQVSRKGPGDFVSLARLVRSPAEYSAAPLDDEQPTRAAVGPTQSVVAARVVGAGEPPVASPPARLSRAVC